MYTTVGTFYSFRMTVCCLGWIGTAVCASSVGCYSTIKQITKHTSRLVAVPTCFDTKVSFSGSLLKSKDHKSTKVSEVQTWCPNM